MQKQLFKLLANILSFYIATLMFPTMEGTSLQTIIIAALILWLVHLIIRPILLIVALPINLLTLGLFSLIINTWMVLLADFFIGGLSIPSFWQALAIALLISVLNMLFKDINKK